MERKSLGIIIFVTIVIQCTGLQLTYGEMTFTGNQPFGDEARLLQTLMRGYERAVRPVEKASRNITVNINFTLTQILGMDEKNQILTSNVWISHEWTDEKLTWDPDEYSGLKTLRLPSHLCWKPDIVLYNRVDDVDGSASSHCLAMVAHDGKVFWAPNVNLRSSCKIDLTFFPFDDQVCKLKFGSWTYDSSQVDLVNDTPELNLDQYIVHGGWDLLSTKVEKNLVQYPCCAEPYADVTFSMYLRRRTLYHIYNVILPCLLLSVLSLLGFWLPVSSSEKVTLGLTVLLAFFVLGLSMADRIPETSEYIPLIGIYLNCIMVLTTISIIMSVFIIHIHNNHPSKPTSSLSNWFYKFTLDYLSTVPFKTSFSKRYHGQPGTHLGENHREHMSTMNTNDRRPLFRLMPLKTGGASILCLQEVDHGTDCTKGRWQSHLKNQRYQKDVKKYWRRVAEIWDKIFFWTVLTAITLCTVFILLVIPACKKPLPM